MSEPQSLHLGKREVVTLPLSTPVIARRTVLPSAPFAVTWWVLRAVCLRPSAEQTASWYIWTAAGEDIGTPFHHQAFSCILVQTGCKQQGGLEVNEQQPNLFKPQWDNTKLVPQRDFRRIEPQVPTATTYSWMHPLLAFLPSLSHLLHSLTCASMNHLPNKPPVFKYWSQGLCLRDRN